jgi:predicted nucleic acid-binding protein
MPDVQHAWPGIPTVVDASVGFKWFDTHEPGADVAARLLEQHAEGHILLMAPEHLLIEIVHALGRRRAGGSLTDAIDTLCDFDVVTVPLDRGLLHDAARISTAEGLALYDAVYVALAARLDAELVTADVRQASTRKCRVRLVT